MSNLTYRNNPLQRPIQLVDSLQYVFEALFFILVFLIFPSFSLSPVVHPFLLSSHALLGIGRRVGRGKTYHSNFAHERLALLVK